jgi:O-antigen ligase
VSALFLIGLVFPGQVFFGELRISLYRIALMVAFIPAVIAIVGSPVKKLYFIDVLIIVYTAFCVLSFMYHGNGVVTAGIFVLETLGPYFLARAAISDPQSMRQAFRLGLLCLLALLPFTLYENLTGTQPLMQAARSIFPYVYPPTQAEMRMGLHRPQVVFEHAILYGMYAAIFIGPAMYVIGYSRAYVLRLVALAAATFATLLSMSAGPLVAAGFQLMLIAWDQLFFIRTIKWKTFIAGLISSYIVILLFSNRPAINVFIDYFTFNSGTGFTRVNQWNCGMISVNNNPILGFGLGGDWSRCPGVTNSIDNFFLAIAMRNGAPAILALVLAMILILVQVGGARVAGRPEPLCRRGVLIAIVGISVGAATVHLWNATYAMLFFLLGSAMWLLDDSHRLRRADQRMAGPGVGAPQMRLDRGPVAGGVAARTRSS